MYENKNRQIYQQAAQEVDHDTVQKLAPAWLWDILR